MVPILQGGAKALYALLDVACKDFVESEASRVVELLEEVLQQPVLVIKLEEATLIGGLGTGRLELALFVDVRDDGEFAYLGCILDLCTVL